MTDQYSSPQNNMSDQDHSQQRIPHEQSNFIQKAYDLVNNPAHSEIIHWNKSGTSFIIEDIDRFEKEVLHLYFRHSRYQSFVRQLNMYDFHKIRNGDYYCDNKSEFRHTEFTRGNANAVCQIKRKCFQVKSKEKESSKSKKIIKSEKKASKKKISPKRVSKKTTPDSDNKLDVLSQECSSFFGDISIEPEIEEFESQQSRNEKTQAVIAKVIQYYENKTKDPNTKVNKINECIELAQKVKDNWLLSFQKISGAEDLKYMKQTYYKTKTILKEKHLDSKRQTSDNPEDEQQKALKMEMELFQFFQEENVIIQSIFRAQIKSTLVCITSEAYLNNNNGLPKCDTLMGW